MSHFSSNQLKSVFSETEMHQINHPLATVLCFFIFIKNNENAGVEKKFPDSRNFSIDGPFSSIDLRDIS